VLEAVLYVLRTGIQWKALPKAYGAASSIHEYFSEWAEAGFFRRMRQEGLLTYDEVHGLGWEWQSVDGCIVKAPLARDAAGRNPTDRRKKGTKHSVTVESHGLPIGIVLDGGNRHDVRSYWKTP
jgi:putative transposase